MGSKDFKKMLNAALCGMRIGIPNDTLYDNAFQPYFAAASEMQVQLRTGMRFPLIRPTCQTATAWQFSHSTLYVTL